MRRLLIVVGLVVAGCAGPAATTAPTAAPTATALPTGAPTATSLPTRAPADIAAELGDSVDVLYCANDPKADWCASLPRKGKLYTFDVQATSVFIATNLADNAEGRQLAGWMCPDIAALHYDEHAVDLGVRQFHVLDRTGQIELATCEAPDV
ncbi:MAG: hypothetical protein ACJ77C_07790 [Chloroflexota bacterium]